MQSGGGHQQVGVSGHGRSTVASASASPSSSSSAASAFDQQSHRQQLQQQQLRQTMQQQILRRSEGGDFLLSYPAGASHGLHGAPNFASVSGSMQLPQSARNFIDLSQHGSPNISDQSQPHMLNSMQQAYLQYAFPSTQQKSALGVQSQQHLKPGMFGTTGKDQDARLSNMKMEEHGSIPVSNQSQLSSKKYSDQAANNDKRADHSQWTQPDDRTDPKLNHPALLGQSISSAQMMGQQSQEGVMNMSNNLIMASQMQAMQALARNIDLSNPANANMVSQLAPFMQSRMNTHQELSETSAGIQSGSHSKQHAASPMIGNESSPRGHSSSEISGQSGSCKTRQTGTPSNLGVPLSASVANSPSSHPVQQFSANVREKSLISRQPSMSVHGMPPVSPLASANLNHGVDSLLSKTPPTLMEASQPLSGRVLSRSPSQSNEGNIGNPSTSQGSNPHLQMPHVGFTKQQLHVLKAQILAFRRLKKGDGTLPRELLQSVVPPPLDLQSLPALSSASVISKDKSAGENRDNNERDTEPNEKGSQMAKSAFNVNSSMEEARDDRLSGVPLNVQDINSSANNLRFLTPLGKGEHQGLNRSVKSDPETEPGNQENHTKGDSNTGRGKELVQTSSVSDPAHNNKPIQSSNSTQAKETSSSRKYHGPLFDFPVFTRKHDALGPSLMNSNNSLTLAYDITDLFADGIDVIRKRKRQEKIQKIDKILAVNLERKRIRPDLVMRLQIESKKLQLAELQARLRDEIEQQQQEIMAMPERPYRKFIRLCERQRQELNRQAQASLKATREKQLKSVFQWRKKLLEAHWAIRDARTARNRGVHKYHEKMLREFSKNKDDDRNKRMEALKNNDVERYREMLLEQQNSVPGEAAERYAVLSSFLTQTEDYLHKLGGKITAAKNQQEVEETANAAAAAARAQGLSEEEVRAAAACAREEVMIRNRFSEMNAPKDSSSVNKYYHLAHAVNERVFRQPSMLKAGTLRDYQLVGLQWMLSLYNNKLNGILADEMGLGKTVQVMSLFAYLMEFKGNYGPHLIIVPNAVLVNWKSELHNWLPSVSCIYYVGGKDQRSKLFSQEVLAMKFNVLVTTYEFIMYDRSKLSKIDWKYIIIDEAQRMKDRESVLARDLDRYRCQRRLLLTGTPLQNDLKELWSLLNLLLPEVFDNKKAFHDWFSQPFQREGPGHNAEDDWLETEKKVIIIHRLHQILEPFMLRRRVEDVEGSLPPKVSIVLKCRMSAIQSAIYDWIKTTGTLRVDPEDEQRKVQKNPIYQAKTYKTLNNRCMELRKACNHPLLNYPYFNDLSKDFLVRACGKMWVLDRILIKLQRTGHRVLLFSTMTKLLDIVEEYLQWRRLVFRRIDGMTSLEDRESAIVDFNDPDTDCFIFLLSIRAAGRGLNLQSADTVIIYDPDPNPKNEEQAVARAHRIGQTREVKVIYMESVVDKISSHQKEDEFRRRGIVDLDNDLAGKDRYMGSIESLIRNNIQQYKIDMADEVINAGRFDQRTTHEERRLTLETLLHDEERYQETVHDVPSLHEVNRMIARSEEEVEIFDQMDEELDWTDDMTSYNQVPSWLRASTKEVNAAIANLSKKPSKNSLYGGVGSAEVASETERRRGRPKAKRPVYAELDDENSSDASSEERNAYSAHEEGEVEEFEDDDSSEAPCDDKDQSEEEGPVSAEVYEYQGTARSGNNNIVDEAASTGSSSHSRKLMPAVSPSCSSQKFGSLSALDSRSNSRSKKMADDLEEMEIAVSGDSMFDQQHSGSWNRDRDEAEDEQVVQPKIRRKRSIRLRPRLTVDRVEKPGERSPPHRTDPPVAFHPEYKYKSRTGDDRAHKVHGDVGSSKSERADSLFKSKRSVASKKAPVTQTSLKSGRISCKSDPPDDTAEFAVGSLDSRGTTKGPKNGAPKITEIVQRKCKNVISRLQRRIDHEGHQIVPLLTQFWKRIENSGGSGGDNLVDLRKIHFRLDRFEYSGVMEVVADVQFMLKCSMQHYGFSYEVRDEARKVHDLFFDILYIAFPDIDFREARNSLSFFGSVGNSSGPGSSKRTPPGPNKRQKSVKEMETPYQKSQNRMPIQATQKEAKFGNRPPIQQDADSPVFTHPGELVVCKKKRKDREKLHLKPGLGSSGTHSSTGFNRNVRSPIAKDSVGSGYHSPVQGWNTAVSPQQGSSAGGSVGWANPVKRLRTDSGRRRPSQY